MSTSNSNLFRILRCVLLRYSDIQELCALYCLADVLVITPIRDGMNISPFEYVVSREAHDTLATVVLSEFTGCARSLGGAILVNPWSTSEVSQIIYTTTTDTMSS
jgi:trehalose 6-phosphate synthase